MRPSESFASVASSALERRGSKPRKDDETPRSQNGHSKPQSQPPLGFQAIAEAVDATLLLVRFADGCADTLAGTTKAEVCACLVDGLASVVYALDQVALFLPRDPIQQRVVARMLSGRTKASENDPPVISVDEAFKGLDAFMLAILDFRTAVAEVSEEDLAEIVEIGLPLANRACRLAQRSARRMHRSALQLSSVHRSTVMIEDLDAPVPHTGGIVNLQSAMSDVEGTAPPVHVTICRPRRRYMWKPLWPRLRTAIIDWSHEPWVPEVANKACHIAVEKPVQAAAVLAFFGPAALMGVAYCTPVVLLADAALQRAYTWQGPDAVEDAVDGIVQTSTVGYLSARLLLRQSWRLATLQAKRWLDGRTPTEAAVETFQQWCQDPVGCAKASLTVASSIGTKLCRGAKQVQRQWTAGRNATNGDPKAARRPAKG
mmetsp:Transcript_32115/g.75401  ORF Transcript_32115/g.75401 Transcript_32115/m.75401 type:complete len:430 (+) Transcript_32115:63-1352(+)